MKNMAPLSRGFMLVAILGFVASAIFLIPISLSWGFTMLLFFSVMFLASFQSMTKGPV